jgi:hypothetical protein
MYNPTVSGPSFQDCLWTHDIYTTGALARTDAQISVHHATIRRTVQILRRIK